MGVQGLWELLAPVGRRVSVETLAGKKLAIDASIWMVQFMKAMRDEKGEMVRNAHLLGFFRRICKLLFLRTKPVFVFDGATPPLKRRTIASRRRHRDAARAKIRKTAEKLLLTHVCLLWAPPALTFAVIMCFDGYTLISIRIWQLKAKRLEELAAEIKNGRAKKCDPKGKQVESGRAGESSMDRAFSAQESLDELLAASLAAEEERELTEKAEASAVSALAEEEGDYDENEEMILPLTTNNIDPAVLASLPPSMQLDLLVQMRERVMAENRQKYQKIKKVPAKFSELQIQSYLKTVAFRREIDEVQRCAAGRGLGGVQTSRIASESNREFIFSSSFTGDKLKLTTRIGKDGDADNCSVKEQNTSGFTNGSSHSKSATDAPPSGELLEDLGDVETYQDERGRVRVSRVRALGIRMTRDIQRNLDFMKEYEQENSRRGFSIDQGPSGTKRVPDVHGLFESNETNVLSSNEDNNEIISKNVHESAVEVNGSSSEPSFLRSKDTIEISFLEDQGEVKDSDDKLFLSLVSGGPASNFLSDAVHSEKSPKESDNSECIWEEAVVEEKTGTPKEDEKDGLSSLVQRGSNEEDEVDWKEALCHTTKVASDSPLQPIKVSRGLLEEEHLIEEAIRRSLEDLERQNSAADNLNLGTSSRIQSDNQSSLGFDSNDLEPFESGGKTCDSLETHSTRNMSYFIECGTSKGINIDEQDVMLDTEQAYADAQGPADCKLTWKHQSEDTKKYAGSDSGLEVPAETNGKLSYMTKSNMPEYVVSETHSSQNWDSIQPSGRINDNNYLKKNIVMDEVVVNTDLRREKSIVEDADLSRPIVGNIETEYHIDDHSEVSEAGLEEEISLLRQEQLNLGDEQRKLERNAESVSSEMFVECQELLQLFGLPYIIAPMEAEAQCAYMERKSLVDGVVTDDSDVFLFGARSVYKNIFDDRKYVETYFMKDIESELGLTREKLIRMALLLGSDYTEGVSGIGIVNAIEVVHAFPEEYGLNMFREWIESPDPSILGNLDNHSNSSSKKRTSKASKKGADATMSNAEESTFKGHDDQPSTSGNDNIMETFMSKHRNVSKNWHIPSSFPSEAVISAYTSPQIDESTDPFSWGKPDINLLRKMCWERFGWNSQKADELLVPVLNEYNKHQTQLRLEAFYMFNERFAKIRSQRIKKAVKGITGGRSSDLTDDLAQEEYSGKKLRRKKRTHKIVQSDSGSEKSGCRSGRSELSAFVSGRARGMNRARGRGSGRSQEKTNFEVNNEVSADDSSDQEEMENHTIPEAVTELHGNLQSRRPPKQVKYAEGDHNNVSSDKIIDGSELHQAAMEQELIKREIAVGSCANQCDEIQQGTSSIHDSPRWESDENDGLASGCTDGKQSSPMDTSSRDYLFSGGGFCLDESEDMQQDAMAEPSARMPEESAEPPLKEVDVSGDQQHLDKDASQQVNAQETSELEQSVSVYSSRSKGRAKHGLSAMPSLKRKRTGS
ncbi:DNA repair protein UVH3 isoform X2 [Ananas comosus]|uniref:DNA repair protein UVH3 isoform X2 n=1 Tax=Ananas comosus TaxID=4615 RepID=A0A6P5F9D8_ANACO|nr:DNA repair protein UVH3 isoform X2 [Ananas comosus]